MTRHYFSLALAMSLLWFSGCGGGRAAESMGKTFYLDGAGNWGFGTYDVPTGLKEAGYHGDVEIFVWTTSLVPLIDQVNIVAAKFRADALARRIEQYHRRYPQNKINVVALSAGTGVAMWAIEDLGRGTKVQNVILLGSSLSNDYDVSRALRNITGKIYAYHSPNDEVLAAVTIVGTIDGKRGVESVGQVGLKVPGSLQDRVVNVAWDRGYIRYGWTGAHTDCTRKDFVREVLAKHVVGARDDESMRRKASVARSRFAEDHEGSGETVSSQLSVVGNQQ